MSYELFFNYSKILKEITATSYNVEGAFVELQKYYRMASNRYIQLIIKFFQRKFLKFYPVTNYFLNYSIVFNISIIFSFLS